ncbi:YihY/virulence factor BrkB family protein [Cytophagaceae bacterium ABcell3]|nr:YihY/virulence factor BrkB family protein [Cytophagaceae bacterium ABcell3]
MEKGRHAERPKQIPAKGWKEVLIRVKDNFTSDYLDVVSAGVGFYFFLALFPLIAASIAIYGLIFDPQEVEQHIEGLAGALPQEAHTLISQGLQNLVEQSEQGLGWALVISILVSLWSANQGTKAVFDGVNIAYNEKIERSFIKNNLLGFAVTLGGIVVGLISAVLVIGFPAVVGRLGLPETLTGILSFVRWPLLFAIVIFSFGVIYKVSPDRENPKFRWTSPGAVFATCLWIAGSLLFSLYVDNFGDFDATYGSVAAVIILMLWFQLTAISILIGAEINSELEHQTSKDTTTGEPHPMGERGAWHADHVAKTEEKEEEEKEEKHKQREPAKRKKTRRAGGKIRKPNDFRDKSDN